MSGKTLGVVLFIVGVFILHAYQTLAFLWDLVGLPDSAYPPMALLAVLPDPGTAGMIIALAPLTGLLVMVAGGLISGRRANKEVIE